MPERIGKVNLDLGRYDGEDRYSDGDDAESRILSIVEQNPEDINEVIEAEGSWPVLYHLSALRENILNWYPFRKGAKVLELGAGCGAVTGALLKAGLDVCAVDLSLRRSRINARRHAAYDNLRIIVGPMEKVLSGLNEQFDYILLIGVLEYASVFSSDSNPYAAVLEQIKGVMKDDAEVLIAIENKIGLKYLAGCREDHTGRFFEGIEGYPHQDGPRTFSRPELKRLAADCGYQSEFFYPYPDYKFPVRVYSDEITPGKGEWDRNWQNFDAERAFLFDERLAADTLSEAGALTLFANSFLVKLTRGSAKPAERVLFAKISAERKPEFRQATIICEAGGEKKVRKVPVMEAAREHISKMEERYRMLIKKLDGKAEIWPVPCIIREDGAAEFPYQEAESLQDRLREAGSSEAFSDILRDFYEKLQRAYGTEPFQVSEAFSAIFGTPELPEGLTALKITDLDLNYDNIFVGEDGNYIVADYEWTVPFAVPFPFIVYRALLVNPQMAGFDQTEQEAVWKAFGLDEPLRDVFFKMELSFQEYVSGKHNKLEQFRNLSLSAGEKTLEGLLAEAKAAEQLTADREDYRSAFEEQRKASEELTRQRDEYRAAYDKQAEAAAELTRQRDEYRVAYDKQAEAAAELTRQRDEYHEAYDKQAEAAAELTRQRDDFRNAHEEAVSRAEAAEQSLLDKTTELQEYIRKHTHWGNKRQRKN